MENYAKFVESMHEVTVIYYIRPNWEGVRDKIGTDIIVSHLGFCIKRQEDNELVFYHATSDEPKKVVKLDLLKYFEKCLTISSLKGINIAQVHANNMKSNITQMDNV